MLHWYKTCLYAYVYAPSIVPIVFINTKIINNVHGQEIKHINLASELLNFLEQ